MLTVKPADMLHTRCSWDEKSKGQDHMHGEEDGYTVRPVQLGAEPPDNQSDTDDPMLDSNVSVWMDEGFHVGMVQATDGANAHFGCCFNCLEEGHRWRDCKKMPLLPVLQDILNREVLNRKGVLEAREAMPP